MLARVTYGLVIVAVGTLIGGFFTDDSNVLLFISIGLSVGAIALVLVGWARRAREAPVGFEEDLAFAEDEEEEEALLGALDEEELAFVEDRPRRSRRTSRSKARPRTKPKASPKAKPKAKPRSVSTAKGRAKRSASAKPRPARKAKPKSSGKGGARPKRKPPRRRPGSP